jgi:hypothetical protein
MRRPCLCVWGMRHDQGFLLGASPGIVWRCDCGTRWLVERVTLVTGAAPRIEVAKIQ